MLSPESLDLEEVPVERKLRREFKDKVHFELITEVNSGQPDLCAHHLPATSGKYQAEKRSAKIIYSAG